MRNILYWVHYPVCLGNRTKLLASLTLLYYKLMKHFETQFKRNRELLMQQTNDGTIHTVYGTVEVRTTPKAILDVDKLIKTVPVKQLMELSQIRVNLVMKQLGNQFDKVVLKWYDSKSVLFK